MDATSTELALITPDQEVEEEPQRRQVWHLFTPRTERKHRIHDLVERLKRDLSHSQRLNERLSGMLSDALKRNTALESEVADLTERLRLAEAANEANARGVDFTFAQRRIDGPEDQATMPVSQVELLDDGSVRAVAADAATALLERVVPQGVKPAVETRPFPVAASPVRSNATLDPYGLVDEEDEPEVYNATASGWQVRQREPLTPVTWGRGGILRASESSTGTFRVTPLHQRGTGPTALPGIEG